MVPAVAAAMEAAAAAATGPTGERSAVERSSGGPDAVEEPDVLPPVAVAADGPYGDEAAAAAAEVDVRESSF